jgi:PAS domain-containing protein
VPEQTARFVRAEDQTKGTGSGEIRTRFGGLGGRLRSTRLIILLSVLIVSAIVATAGFTIWHTHESTLEEHQRDMNSMGIVLAEQTSRYVQVIDLILKEVQSRIATLDLINPKDFQRQLGTQEVHLNLADRLRNIPQADAIVLIDANGFILNWSRAWPLVSVDVSHRDYYNHLKEHDDSDMFIGSQAKNSGTGRPSLFIARRINGTGGRFLGLVLAVVDIESLSEFYRAAGDHSREAITLLRRDGTMVMRYPDPEAAVGVKLPQGSPWYAKVAEGGGQYVTRGILDGKASLVSVHPLTEYPLVVDLLIETTDAFAQWRGNAVYIGGFAAAAALAIAGLFGVLAHQFRRQAEQNSRFDAVLSNITQGVCFFDSNKRLLLWNRRYLEIYNLPRGILKVGLSLEEIVGYRDEAGSAPNQSISDYLDWQVTLAATNQVSTTVVWFPFVIILCRAEAG